MNRPLPFGILFAVILFVVPYSARALGPPAMTNVFDQSSGAIVESDFTSGVNWASTFGTLTRNSGAEFFESDNGNFNNDFIGLRLVKELGGVIQNQPYQVSFFIAANSLNPRGRHGSPGDGTPATTTR